MGLRTPAWMAQAACKGNTEYFFPDRGAPRDADGPKTICQSCPVKEPCLTHAVRYVERQGIWGGTSGRERRKLFAKVGQ